MSFVKKTTVNLFLENKMRHQLLEACSPHLLGNEKNLLECAKALNLNLDISRDNAEASEKLILKEILRQGLAPIQDKALRMQFFSEYATFFSQYINEKNFNFLIILDAFVFFQRLHDSEIVYRKNGEQKPPTPISELLKNMPLILKPLAKKEKNPAARFALGCLYWNYSDLFKSETFSEKNLYEECITLFAGASRTKGFEHGNTILVQIYFSKRYLELNPRISVQKRNELAMPYLEAAAALGDGPSNYHLGMIYLLNPLLTDEQLISFCLPRFKRAQEKGIKNAQKLVAKLEDLVKSKDVETKGPNNFLHLILKAAEVEDQDQEAAESENPDRATAILINFQNQHVTTKEDDSVRTNLYPGDNIYSQANPARRDSYSNLDPLFSSGTYDRMLFELAQEPPKMDDPQNIDQIAEQALQEAFPKFRKEFEPKPVKNYKYFRVESDNTLNRNLEIFPPKNLKTKPELQAFSKAVRKLLLSKNNEKYEVKDKHILEKSPDNEGQQKVQFVGVKTSRGGVIATVTADLTEQRIPEGAVVVVLESAFWVHFLFSRERTNKYELSNSPEAPSQESNNANSSSLKVALKKFAAVTEKKRGPSDEEAPEKDPKAKSSEEFKRARAEKPPASQEETKYLPLLSMFSPKARALAEQSKAENEAAKIAAAERAKSQTVLDEIEAKLQEENKQNEAILKRKEAKFSAHVAATIEAAKRSRREDEEATAANLKLIQEKEEELKQKRQKNKELEESSTNDGNPTAQFRK